MQWGVWGAEENLKMITVFGRIWVLTGRLPDWNLKLPEKWVPYAYVISVSIYLMMPNLYSKL